MFRENRRVLKLDWITIILFITLVGFGWVNIMSASHVGENFSYFDLDQPYGKQMMFIGLTIILIIIILSIEAKFYERFSSVIYIISILSLVGLFIFGKNVNGATSWYGIGAMTIQPSEFAKFATSLAVAKHISDIQTNMKSLQDQLKTVAIITIPSLLILLQNDAGSTIVYASFFFVFYREGLQQIYLILAAIVIVLSVITLKFGVLIAAIVTTVFILGFYFLRKKKRFSVIQPIIILGLCVTFSFAIKMFYDNMLKPHQKDRISLWLRLEKDPIRLAEMKQTILYNLNESEKAISSGGLTGKGFLSGNQTQLQFIPEQWTDFAFCVIGEEFGFIGSILVLSVFLILFLRILKLSYNTKDEFLGLVSIGILSVYLIHFIINLGMVVGILPVIGIPLPFISYGGSSLLVSMFMLGVVANLYRTRKNYT
jgi:rod shape determining protein RodA